MYFMGKHKVLLFTISNSVRQGGILSPKLFSVYMDDLSKLLINSGIGCVNDTVCFNRVFYADELCLRLLASRTIEYLSQ